MVNGHRSSFLLCTGNQNVLNKTKDQQTGISPLHQLVRDPYTSLLGNPVTEETEHMCLVNEKRGHSFCYTGRKRRVHRSYVFNRQGNQYQWNHFLYLQELET